MRSSKLCVAFGKGCDGAHERLQCPLRAAAREGEQVAVSLPPRPPLDLATIRLPASELGRSLRRQRVRRQQWGLV